MFENSNHSVICYQYRHHKYSFKARQSEATKQIMMKFDIMIGDIMDQHIVYFYIIKRGSSGIKKTKLQHRLTDNRENRRIHQYFRENVFILSLNAIISYMVELLITRKKRIPSARPASL